ncbi:MAG: hypothetical protein LH606_19550 [Cytophagaceae bacterium]|nr:hypothetical protein [Cytophagaceae bacterium]
MKKNVLQSQRCLWVLLGGLLSVQVALAQIATVGVTGFSAGPPRNVPLAFTPNGQPVVAYSDGAFSGKVVVQRFSAGIWNPVGSPTGISLGINFVQQVSLAINPANGDIFVAYKEGNNVYVQRWNGVVWGFVGAPLPSGSNGEISIALSPSGVPFVAYQSSPGIVVVQRCPAATWLPVGLPLSAGASSQPSLVFTPSGSGLYVAFVETGIGITVKRFITGVWNLVGVSLGTPGIVSNPCLAFGAFPFPHVGYQEGPAIRVQRFLFGWTVVGPPGFPGRVQTNTWLGVSQLGTPVAAYQDGTIKASVQHFSAGTWQILVGLGAFSSGLVEFPALAFRPTNDNLYVSYRDIGLGPDRATVKRTTPAGRSLFLREIAEEEPVGPYPNPIVGRSFYVPVDDAPNARLNLTDLRGISQPYWSVAESDKLIHVLLDAPLPPGIYLLRVAAPDTPDRLHKLLLTDQ